MSGNEFLYFSESQIKSNDFRGPDVFVVLGVEPMERKAWVTWLEDGKTPDVVIELVSVATRDADYGVKKSIYGDRLGVKDYFIYDPFTARLDGFRLSPETGQYIRLLPNAAGRLPVSSMGLELGVLPGNYEGTEAVWLRWFRPSGDRLWTQQEKAQQAREWAEAEKQRAEAEKQRAEAEKQRAEAEKQRAEAAETRVRELEERLRQLEASDSYPDP